MSLLPGFPNICASSLWKPSPSWIWTLSVYGNEQEQLRTKRVLQSRALPGNTGVPPAAGAPRELQPSAAALVLLLRPLGQPSAEHGENGKRGGGSPWGETGHPSSLLPFVHIPSHDHLVPRALVGQPDSCHCRLSSEDSFAVCLFCYDRHISSAVIKLISSCYFPISNRSTKTDFPLLNTGSITLGTVNSLSKDFSTYRRVSDSLSICRINPILKSQF